MSFDGLKPFLARIAAGETLKTEESATAFDIVLAGDASPAQIGALLLGLRSRGETAAEIAGAAQAMRRHMLWVKAPDAAIDIAGTGGDGSSLFNISTASCLVVAACGVPVAKQGGRSVTSRSGAADVLEAAGVNIALDFPRVEKALAEIGFAFLSAPRHHPAMKGNAALRAELGSRTIFNLLGPLTNPAGVRRHLIGVADRKWLMPFAEALQELGSERAWIIHGSDGLDEITTNGPTFVVELKSDKVRSFEIHPEEAGLFVSEMAQLKGGEPATNAAALKALLGGAQNAYRNIVLFNAAAALVVAGKAEDLRAGAALAREAIDSGRARQVLDKLVALSRRG